jgi:transglutaminase-like putative cysteine protease
MILLRLLLLLPLLLALPAQAATVHVRYDRSVDSFEVHPDLSYVLTSTLDATLLTPRGLRQGERSRRSFYPDHQSLEVLEAWVDQPDGSRVTVEKSSIFTRPSAAAQGAPGFSGAETTTVLFPQLRPGSRIHIKWRLVQKTPPLLGFNVLSEAAFEVQTVSDETIITLPATVKLQWRKRGPFEVTDATTAGTRRVTATIRDVAPRERERDMVALSDFVPLFAATTLPDLAAMGAIYHRESEGRAVVTPEVAALAAQIVGDKTGLEAARAIYDWVAGNIRYVAIYLDPNDGWVPHAASAVLAAGYGDCKDHVVIMQALLAARGIKAVAAIIDWGDRTTDLPLPLPNQFNHAIVYLPAFNRYANPTDPYSSFDALERRLSGKTVVLATPEGQVARTPAATPADNRYSITQRIVVAPDGTLSGHTRIETSANLDSRLRTAVANSSSLTDLAERVLARTPEGGFGTFIAGNPRNLDRPFPLDAQWKSPQGVTFQGKAGQGRIAYLRVPAGVDIEPANALRAKLSPPGTRQTPILAGVGEYDWDTTLVLPPGMRVTQLPDPVRLATTAGSYTATYIRTGMEVHVSRRLVIGQDVVMPDDYGALEKLLLAPIDDARSVMVVERADS